MILWRASWRRHDEQLGGISKLLRQTAPVAVHKGHTFSTLVQLSNCSLSLIGSVANGEVLGIFYAGGFKSVTAGVTDQAHIVDCSIAARGNNERSSRGGTFREDKVGGDTARMKTYSNIERRVELTQVTLDDTDVANAGAEYPLGGSAYRFLLILYQNHLEQHPQNLTTYTMLSSLLHRRPCSDCSYVTAPYKLIIIIIIIRNLYSTIMPLGGYRGAGGTGR